MGWINMRLEFCSSVKPRCLVLVLVPYKCLMLSTLPYSYYIENVWCLVLAYNWRSESNPKGVVCSLETTLKMMVTIYTLAWLPHSTLFCLYNVYYTLHSITTYRSTSYCLTIRFQDSLLKQLVITCVCF